MTWAQPISPPPGATWALSDMFCDLNGTTRSPRLARGPGPRHDRRGGQPGRHVVEGVVGARGGAAEILELVPPVPDHGVRGVHRAVGPGEREARAGPTQQRPRGIEADRPDQAV